MEWAAHLEHLQTIFQEFNADAVISKLVLICLFHDGFRPSIRARTEQKGRQKDTWDQVIQKAITAEAKAALNLLFWLCEINACYPRDYHSDSKPTKDQTRDQGSLSFRPQEAQTMPAHCSERAETSKRLRRDHQKGRHNRNCCNCGPCDFRP